jgi:hypothetical protein
MNISVKLSDCEVKAIKAYLKQFKDEGEKVTAKDIKDEINGIISAVMQTGSLGDYYQQYCTQ